MSKVVQPTPRVVALGDRPLQEAVTEADIGGRVVLYEGECNEWRAHPDGVVVRIGQSFLLNGREPVLYEGQCNSWCAHPDGVVVRFGDRFLLNGREPALYEGKCNSWSAHPDGVVVQIGNRLLLNGRELLYEGNQYGWLAHPAGVVINTLSLTGGCRLELVVHRLLHDPTQPGGPVPDWILAAIGRAK